jgi:hypothetical protein
MKRVKLFDGEGRTREEKENCFPHANGVTEGVRNSVKNGKR